MANLRPYRGKRSDAETANIILEDGEVFFELPEAGAGTGPGRIKIGDGTTTYPNLPYFYDYASDGHIIENTSGTDMAARANLQFADAKVTDDSTNDRTKVEILQTPMSLSDFNNAQNLPDGIYPITSDDLTVLSADIISYDNTSSGLSASNTQTAIDELAASTVGSKCLVISQTSIAALPATIQNTSITSDMVCIKAELSNPSAQSGDWTVTTSNGSLSVTGTISGTTDLKMYLVESR